MIYDAGNRIMIGIAFAGIFTFIALTMMKILSVDASVDEIWINMLGSILVGSYFGIASFIYDYEQWSFLKQFLTHFFLSLIVFFPIAIFLTGWIPLNFTAITIGIGIYIFTYLVFMIGTYVYLKKQAELLNAAVKKK